MVSIVEAKTIIDREENVEENVLKILSYYDNEEQVSSTSYYAILNIPKIKLNRGFYDKTSEFNDVNKNIYYLKESIPLGEQNSTIILAAHRGTSSVSYFNNLEKLVIGDDLYLNYHQDRYRYKIRSIYNERKDGHLNIYRDDKRDSLILITCNRLHKSYQTIYVAYRVNN